MFLPLLLFLAALCHTSAPTRFYSVTTRIDIQHHCAQHVSETIAVHFPILQDTFSFIIWKNTSVLHTPVVYRVQLSSKQVRVVEEHIYSTHESVIVTYKLEPFIGDAVIHISYKIMSIIQNMNKIFWEARFSNMVWLLLF